MIDLYLKLFARKVRIEFVTWHRSGWSNPAPSAVKRAVFKRYCLENAIWVETGTYLGETAKFLASKTKARYVYSLEPSKALFDFSSQRLRRIKNLEIINSSSELGLESVIHKVAGKINFWLDGHNSGDITFMGSQSSPIEIELEVIKRSIQNFEGVVIFIDDVRLFNGTDGYCNLSALVNWSESVSLTWAIEHDIFIMYSPQIT
jgi:hypothetical protein